VKASITATLAHINYPALSRIDRLR